MDYLERMKIELGMLETNIEQSTRFLKKEIVIPCFTDEVQRIKLACQIEHMTAYANVLRERIKYDRNKVNSNKGDTDGYNN